MLKMKTIWDNIIGLLTNAVRQLRGFTSVSVLACFLIYWFYGGVLALTLLTFAIFGFLYQAEDLMVFQPGIPRHSRLFVPRPTSYSLTYENIRVPSEDGKILHMFLIKQPGNAEEFPTLIYFHGNAGNMGHRLENTKELYQFLHINILMVEYRGYGFSEGSPSEAGLYMDARASIEYLYSRNDINHKKIIVFGRSLGGAVAIDLAARPEYAEKIWCLIVENTFTTIPHLVACLIGCQLFKYLPLIIYKNKFLSLRKVQHLSVPSLFICGLSDGLVPPRMSRTLHSHCGAMHKQLVELQSGTHNDTWNCEGYYSMLLNFLNTIPETAFRAVVTRNNIEPV